MNFDYSRLIDSRNRELLAKLNNEKIQINVYESNSEPYWSMKYNSFARTADIFTGKDVNDINSFTHELLHIVQEVQGQSAFKILTVIMLSDSPFIPMFNVDELAEKINNTILHSRMLGDYVAMGFPRDKFIMNYYSKKDEKYFEEHYYELVTANQINLNKLAGFLILYLTSRLHPNIEIKEYQLRLIDSHYSSYINLVTSLDSLCEEWENRTIELNSDFFSHLISRLSDWYKDYL